MCPPSLYISAGALGIFPSWNRDSIGPFGGLMSYLSGAPEDERDFPTLLDIKAAFGFIPNFFRAQTLRPDLIDAEVGLIGTILLKEGALTRRQKEYIFLVCSADNLSTYCMTA